MVKKTRVESIGVEFMDAIFGLAAALCVILVLLSILVKLEGNPSVEREGKYVIIATWDNGIDTDVDLWVRAPNGEASGFTSRDQGGLSLLRDDLGNTNDRVADDKGKITLNPMNREEVTVRSVTPGEYTVNAHLFRVGANHPPEGVTVKIELRTIKQNTFIVSGEFKLRTQGDEKTAFIFTLNAEGKVTASEIPVKSIPWVVRQ